MPEAQSDLGDKRDEYGPHSQTNQSINESQHIKR